MVAVLIVGVCTFSALAEDGMEEGMKVVRGDDGVKYVECDTDELASFVTTQDLVKERERAAAVGNHVLAVEDYINAVVRLTERYYHYNIDGKMDWLFFDCYCWGGADMVFDCIFYGRYIYSSDLGVPFSYNCGVYDVELKRYYSLEEAVKVEKYADLDKALAAADYGVLIGDLNDDGNVDIMDATLSRMYLAGEKEFTETKQIGTVYDYSLKKAFYISNIADMDRDNTYDVNDVTAIQKSAANLDYLA